MGLNNFQAIGLIVFLKFRKDLAEFDINHF